MGPHGKKHQLKKNDLSKSVYPAQSSEITKKKSNWDPPAFLKSVIKYK